MHLSPCVGRASWCSPTPENLQVTPADLTSDPQPGQAQKLQDSLWSHSVLVTLLWETSMSQACSRGSAISQQYFLEVFLLKRLSRAPVLKKEEKDPAWSMHGSQNPEVPGR